jgi:ribokinase/sulfofructose kinase
MSSDLRPFDVVTVDGVDVDLVLTVDGLPGPDEKLMAQLVGNLPGGPAANFACAARRLGLNVAALAEVGDDAQGRLIVDDFAGYGVDTSLIHTRADGRTCFTVILIPPSGEKAILVVPTFVPVHPPDLMRDAFSRARLVYLMPQNHQQFMTISEVAHACGAQVMVDIEPTVGGDAQMMARIMAGCDIASFNQFGFRTAEGVEPSLAAARRLLERGPHTVVVTLGANGALAVTRDEEAQQPGFAVEAVDTTGAGDTFNAAFVTATARGLSLAERLRFACGAGSLAVTGMGPRGRLPTTAEVEEFLAAL